MAVPVKNRHGAGLPGCVCMCSYGMSVLWAVFCSQIPISTAKVKRWEIFRGQPFCFETFRS